MTIKVCAKPACQYTDERCLITVVGWDAAICHCPVDGSVVIWESSNKVDETDKACPHVRCEYVEKCNAICVWAASNR